MRMRKFYPTLNDIYTTSEGAGAALAITNELGKCHLFDGTLSFTYKGQTLTFPNLIGVTQSIPNGLALQHYWVTHWGEQRIGFPIKEFSSAELTRISTFKIVPLIRDFINTNAPKYERLVKTLCYTYDPVSNYDMVEEKTSSFGDQTDTHEIDKAGQDTWLNVPHTSATVTVGENEQFNSTDSDGYLTFANGDMSNSSGNKTTFQKSETTEVSDDGDPTVSHYTTTYDDDSQGRLASYDVRSGSSSTTVSADPTQNSQETKLTPSAGSSTHRNEEFTDTHTHDDDSYTLTRSGNIGVTTSQQMIESERELADFDVVRMWFEELNKWIMLQIWN